MKMRLVRNRAQCLICMDIVESTYRHDYQPCSCGAMFIDGGLDYIRTGARSFDDVKDLCEYEKIDELDSDSTGIKRM